MFKEILGDALPVIEKFAPLIGGVFGSNSAGSLAVLCMHLLANAFGINPSNVKQLGEEIVQNPEAQTILQSLNEQYGDVIKGAVSKIPMPSSIQLTIAVDWDNRN